MLQILAFLSLSLFLQVPSDFDSELVGTALIKDLEKMLSPVGTQENPAVSCLDLAICHGDQFTAGPSQKLSRSLLTIRIYVPLFIGYYWIDPNEGSPKDAIRVFCRGQETCLTPQKSSGSQVYYSVLNISEYHILQSFCVSYYCDVYDAVCVH